MQIFDNVEVKASLVPATRTTDTNGTGIDTLGYDNGMLQVIAGTIDLASTDETYTIKVQESDDDSTYTDVSGATTTVTANNQVKEVRLSELNVARKRYLRAVLDVGGTTPSIAGCAVFVLGGKTRGPVGNAA